MKCPKCGYLGFETSDRCRNCGYDFSLALDPGVPPELPLYDADGAGAPLSDLELAPSSAARTETPSLDLDRVIGEPPAPPEPSRLPTARSTPARPPRRSPEALPLFGPGVSPDDEPVIPPPPPPLSVRRTTRDIPRPRTRVTPRPSPEARHDAVPRPAVAPVAPVTHGAAQDHPQRSPESQPAPHAARIAAAAVDVVLLTAIDIAVLYFTLAIAGLSLDDAAQLPVVPLAGFFAVLAGGYLVAFVGASGQTVGKMLTGIKVIGDDGRRVDMAGAVLRALGCGVSLATAGLGYLLAFVTADGRALHDRISGTRVVSAR